MYLNNRMHKCCILLLSFYFRFWDLQFWIGKCYMKTYEFTSHYIDHLASYIYAMWSCNIHVLKLYFACLFLLDETWNSPAYPVFIGKPGLLNSTSCRNRKNLNNPNILRPSSLVLLYMYIGICYIFLINSVFSPVESLHAFLLVIFS